MNQVKKLQFVKFTFSRNKFPLSSERIFTDISSIPRDFENIVEEKGSNRFLNFDWKQYSFTEPLQKVRNQTMEEQLSFKMEIAPVDKHGEKDTFVGHLKVPYSQEEMPSNNYELLKTQTWYETEFAEKNGKLLSTQDYKQIQVYTKDVVAFSSFITRNGTSNLRLLVDAGTTVLILDDFLEDENLKDYQNLLKTIETWIDVLNGKDLEQPVTIDHNNFLDKGKLLCWYLRHQALLCAGKENLEKADPFFDAFIQFLKGSIVESCREWLMKQNTQSLMFRRFHSVLRNEAVSAKLLIEAIALSQGISVNNSIRDSIPFQTFRDLAAEHMAKTNDLFSFEKEFKAGWTANYVSLLHVEKNLPLKDALGQVVNELNGIIQVLLESGEFLLQVNKNDPQLARYVSCVRDFVAGQLQWHGLSERYYLSCVFSPVSQNDAI